MRTSLSALNKHDKAIVASCFASVDQACGGRSRKLKEKGVRSFEHLLSILKETDWWLIRDDVQRKGDAPHMGIHRMGRNILQAAVIGQSESLGVVSAIIRACPLDALTSLLLAPICDSKGKKIQFLSQHQDRLVVDYAFLRILFWAVGSSSDWRERQRACILLFNKFIKTESCGFKVLESAYQCVFGGIDFTSIMPETFRVFSGRFKLQIETVLEEKRARTGRGLAVPLKRHNALVSECSMSPLVLGADKVNQEESSCNKGAVKRVRFSLPSS